MLKKKVESNWKLPKGVSGRQSVTIVFVLDMGAAGPIHIKGFDGEDIGWPAMKRGISPLEILPGKHRVEVAAYWSNGFSETIEIDFVATAGKKYLVGGYELKPGQDPATVQFQVAEKSGVDKKNTFWSYIGKGIIGILALGLPYTWVIVLPAALVWEYSKKPPQPPVPPEQANSAEASVPKEPPQTRPFEGCCFVWIQDEDTGEVVAGASPKSVKSDADRR